MKIFDNIGFASFVATSQKRYRSAKELLEREVLLDRGVHDAWRLANCPLPNTACALLCIPSPNKQPAKGDLRVHESLTPFNIAVLATCSHGLTAMIDRQAKRGVMCPVWHASSISCTWLRNERIPAHLRLSPGHDQTGPPLSSSMWLDHAFVGLAAQHIVSQRPRHVHPHELGPSANSISFC
jgi:hypothetical protein